MIHPPSAEIIQVHGRLGDAKLTRWLWAYSIGQSVEALEELTAQCRQTHASAVKMADQLKAANVSVLTWLDHEYPACLRALEADAPPLLYLLGSPTRLESRSIAIIGTRRPTIHGKTAAVHAADAAVNEGWAVVSGNAPGVDSAGHDAALKNPAGETLVFPPTPIDQYRQQFPTRAPERTTVVSPFIPGTEIKPWMFLRRNTLVAAHCSAAIVAETGMTGGTHDTIRKLIARHRPTFATRLPENSRYAAAHNLLDKSAVTLIPILERPDSAMKQVLEAAAHTMRHPPVKTAVLPDLFGEDYPL